MNNKIEILAPCGNIDSFVAAVNAGADAVYLGLKDFSARAKAKNFSYEQLNDICFYAKEKKVKVFVALNTLIKNCEIKNVIKNLEQIALSGADAVIVQDLGVNCIIKKYFPDIKMHASTQLTVCNSYGAKQAELLGFKRAVLARELSFEEISSIKNNSNIELEIFCHGALCFCVSGLCLFSSFIGGYSGNRGHCAQPCRRLWKVDNKNGYFLSPKDFQLIDYVKMLQKTGITSLKIEGRLKSADYVSKTVKAYKLLINSDETNYEQNLKQAKEILAFDYARQKTTFNFFKGNKNVFEPEKSKNTGLFLGTVQNKINDEFLLETKYNLNVGDILRIVDKRKDRSSVLKIESLTVNKNCYKIGYDGIYLENNFEVYKVADVQERKIEKMDEFNVTVKKRKNLINKKHIFFNEQKYDKTSNYFFNQKNFLPNLFIRINNMKWLPLIKNVKADIIIKFSKNDINEIKDMILNNFKTDFYFELPQYIDEKEINLFESFINFLIEKKYSRFFLNNISHLYFFKNKNVSLYAGQFLYTLNYYVAQLLSRYKIKAFVSSWEDDLYNIKDLSEKLKNNLIVYLSGFPEIVLSKMKFVDIVKSKNIKSDKDEFRIITKDDENVIVPKYPINLFGFKNKLMHMNIKSFGIDLSYIEPNKNYLSQIMNVFNNNLYLSSANKFNFERGLK
jgi:putative protease